MLKLLVLLQVVLGYYSYSLTLDEVIELAESNSSNNKLHESKLKEIDKKIERIRLNRLPEINIIAGKEKVFFDSNEDNEDLLFGQLRYNLFNGGKWKKGASRLKLQKELEILSLAQRKLETRHQVFQYYFKYNYFSLLAKKLKSLIKRESNYQKMIKKRLDSGIGNESDLLEYQLRREKLKRHLTNIEKKSKSLKEVIGILISKNVSSFKLEPIEAPIQQKIFIGSVEKKDFKGNLELKALDLNNKDNLLRQKTLGSSLYPSVDLEVNYGRQSEQFTGVSNRFRTASALITLTWSIDDFIKAKKSIDLSKSLNISNKHLRTKKERELKVNLTNLEGKISNLLDENQGLRKSGEMAQDLYRISISEYKKGIKDLSSLLNASDEIFEIELSLIGNQKSYFQTIQKLEMLLGRKLI